MKIRKYKNKILLIDKNTKITITINKIYVCFKLIFIIIIIII